MNLLTANSACGHHKPQSTSQCTSVSFPSLFPDPCVKRNGMICHLICILVYDQICIDALKSKDDGYDSSTTTSCAGDISVDWFNSLLNYILIVINVACTQKTFVALSTPGQRNAAIPTKFSTRVFIAFVIAFQLSLCLFITDCVGVSIVWCSTLGWLLMCMQTRIQSVATIAAPTQSTLRTVAFLDCAAIVFYAVVSDAISTIAHLLAVVMGVVLWKLAAWSTNTTKAM